MSRSRAYSIAKLGSDGSPVFGQGRGDVVGGRARSTRFFGLGMSLAFGLDLDKRVTGRRLAVPYRHIRCR